MPPAPGDRLAAFTLSTPGGAIRRWTPGRVTVVSFCAFWCDTWIPQAARLTETERALRGLPFDFVNIAVDGRWSERAAKATIPGLLLLDSGGTLTRRLGVDAVPYTLLVDRAGVVRFASQGIVRAVDLQQTLRGDAASEGGKIHLTFDDFPAPDDDLLLDILRAHRVPATFFCIGRHVAEQRAIVRRAADEGHALQIHGWDHAPGADPQTARCARALADVCGVAPTLCRPPGTDRLIRLSDGKPVVYPVINPYDFQRPPESEVSRRILLAARPGSVVLLHAGVSVTRTVLANVLETLRKRGFTFGLLK